MNRFVCAGALWATVLLCGGFAAAQNRVDPHQAVLDRLESFTVQTVQVNERWSTGPGVLRRWIEVPAKLNGYSTQGARVKLDLTFDSADALVISVFANGGLLYHGDDTVQQPILLTESAQPGEKFLIAVRLDAHAAETRISGCR